MSDHVCKREIAISKVQPKSAETLLQGEQATRHAVSSLQVTRATKAVLGLGHLLRTMCLQQSVY